MALEIAQTPCTEALLLAYKAVFFWLLPFRRRIIYKIHFTLQQSIRLELGIRTGVYVV